MEQLNTLVDSPMESDSGPDSDPDQQSTQEPEWEEFFIDLLFFLLRGISGLPNQVHELAFNCLAAWNEIGRI